MKYLFVLAAILVLSSSAPYFGGITNFCGQFTCCSTPECNSCASNCPFQCQTQACTNNCIENCIQAVPQNCYGGTCNVCSGSNCCADQTCNTCAQTCTNQCGTQQCRNNCVHNCIQAVPQICNSGTCNVCSGSQCCNSQHCNTCANMCTMQCTTPDCVNNCVGKCINTTPSCEGANCNVCVGDQCCPNDTCNNCVNQCYQQTSGCTRACINQCIQTDPIKIALPIPDVNCQEDDAPDVIFVHNNQSKSVNVTTVINIRNVINNTNLIKVPVHANTTNINYVHVPKKQTQHLTSSCCYVLHPPECFYVQTNQTARETKCIRRRHRECSSLCTAPEIFINPQPQRVLPPVPFPVHVPQQRCHYIQQYPWVYCANYQTQNCTPCYYCNQAYNPQYCSIQPQCPLVCRR